MTLAIGVRFLRGGLSVRLLCLLVWMAGCTSTSAPPSPRSAYTGSPRPNVVIYLVDTLRADRLGTYGYAKDTTPHMDAFAKTGVVFENAIAPDTCTVGSAPSLLTGQYTVTHGVDAFGKQVASDVPMLQTLLDASGYECGSFITNVNAGPSVGLDRGFRTLHDAVRTFRDRKALRTVPLPAIETWLDGVDTRPFFLYVHTAEPHRPYTPPSPWKENFDDGYTGEITGVYRGKNGYEHAKTPQDRAHVRALYDGEVAFADAGFGALLQALEQRGLRENTVIVLTSDHGEELFDHGGWNHGHSVYRELAHIPLIVSGPGIPAGVRVPELVSLVDVTPSVLERVKVKGSAGFEGRSLWKPDPERAVFTRSSYLPRKAAMRKGEWTLIQNEREETSLFHRGRDPLELTDVSGLFPQRVASMRAQLRAWLAGQTHRPVRALSAEETERLRLLGYIE